MSNFNRLVKVFHMVFQDESIELFKTTTANDIEGWDSLSHINLVLAIEMEFGIKFSSAEVRKMENVGELLELIEKKVAP